MIWDEPFQQLPEPLLAAPSVAIAWLDIPAAKVEYDPDIVLFSACEEKGSGRFN
jgi:hypothetical protein